jgi:hypothetical protein
VGLFAPFQLSAFHFPKHEESQNVIARLFQDHAGLVIWLPHASQGLVSVPFHRGLFSPMFLPTKAAAMHFREQY